MCILAHLTTPRYIMKKILILLSIPFLFNTTFGQNKEKINTKRVSLDLYGGLPIFYGDVKNKFGGFNATARANWYMTSGVAIGGEFSYGSIKGEDQDDDANYFTKNYLKAMLGGEIYFFQPFKFHQLAKWFQPYMGLSIGVIKSGVNSAGNYEGESLRYYNGLDFAHQWHLGAKIKLMHSLDLNTRYCFMPLKSDDFDNLNPSVPANRANDLISSFEIGISYHIGGKGKKPIIWYDDNNDLFESSSDSLLSSTEIENAGTLDAKIDAVNRKRMENEVNMTLEIDKLRYENDQLKKQLDLLETKLNQIQTVNESNVSNSNGTPVETELYEAFLKGPSKANYFIVSGSYSLLDNALSRVNELNQKGYTPIIMREPAADLNRVVLATAETFEEALMFWKKYRKQIDPKAWIIKMKKD